MQYEPDSPSGATEWEEELLLSGVEISFFFLFSSFVVIVDIV